MKYRIFYCTYSDDLKLITGTCFHEMDWIDEETLGALRKKLNLPNKVTFLNITQDKDWVEFSDREIVDSLTECEGWSRQDFCDAMNGNLKHLEPTNTEKAYQERLARKDTEIIKLKAELGVMHKRYTK